MDIKVSGDGGEIKINKDEMDKIASYVKKALPEFVKDGIGMIDDQFKYWRGSRRLNLMRNRIKRVEESGLKIQEVPAKLFVPILENGSLENDDSLQERWSNMLANASVSTDRVKNSYPEILKQLESIEIIILDGYFEQTKNKTKEELVNNYLLKEKVMMIYGLDSEKYDLIADNLIRLRLLRMPSSVGGVSIGDNPISLFTYDHLKLTELGIDFIKAIKFSKK